MTDHDIDVSPGTIWDDLNEFSQEYFDGDMHLEQNLDKKYFLMSVDDGKL